MSDTLLRARSATEIVDAAFSLYRRNFAQYIVVTAIAYTPAIIMSLIIGVNGMEHPAGAIALIASFVVGFIASALMTGTIVAFGSQVYLGEREDVARAVKVALPRVPALLVATLLVGVLYIVGFLCAFVGFFYVFARYFAVVPALILEKRSIRDSLRRSTQLSDGRKMHILGSLALVYGIYIIASFGLTLVAAFLGSAVILLLVNSLFNIVAFPIIGLATLALYYDARVRGDAYDLEQMAAGLDVPVETVPAGSTAV